MSTMWYFRSVMNYHSSSFISVSSHFSSVCISKFTSWLWWFISSRLTEVLRISLKAWLFSSCCWAGLFCFTLIYKSFSPKLLKKEKVICLSCVFPFLCAYKHMREYAKNIICLDIWHLLLYTWYISQRPSPPQIICSSTIVILSLCSYSQINISLCVHLFTFWAMQFKQLQGLLFA